MCIRDRVKNEFDAVVDKCEVVIYTDPAECTRVRHEVAIPTFEKRDERLDNLTDESVDVYYSCILCQAFSPSHVCVVTDVYKRQALDSMRSGLVDLGMTEIPFCTAQRKPTWAGVWAYFVPRTHNTS